MSHPSPAAWSRRVAWLFLWIVGVNVAAHLPGRHDLPLGHHA